LSSLLIEDRLLFNLIQGHRCNFKTNLSPLMDDAFLGEKCEKGGEKTETNLKEKEEENNQRKPKRK
jgi:hypothetical protein